MPMLEDVMSLSAAPVCFPHLSRAKYGSSAYSLSGHVVAMRLVGSVTVASCTTCTATKIAPATALCHPRLWQKLEHSHSMAVLGSITQCEMVPNGVAGLATSHTEVWHSLLANPVHLF